MSKGIDAQNRHVLLHLMLRAYVEAEAVMPSLWGTRAKPNVSRVIDCSTVASLQTIATISSHKK